MNSDMTAHDCMRDFDILHAVMIPVLVWFSAYFDVFYLSTPKTIYKLLLIRCSAITCYIPYYLLVIPYPISLVINLERVCFIIILLAFCYPSVWFFHLRNLRPRPLGRHRTTRHSTLYGRVGSWSDSSKNNSSCTATSVGHDVCTRSYVNPLVLFINKIILMPS